VKDPPRNLPLALIGGIGVIAALYISVNVAYFYVLTPTEIAGIPESSAVATQVISRVLGAGAGTAMAGVLAMSIFGALQIAALVCARVPYAMARDGMFFAGLARVSTRTQVPVPALLVQGAWAAVLVLSGSYDVLTDYAIFSVLIFVGLAASSVFILRRQVPAEERAYQTWGYPFIPAAFLLVTVWLLINTLLTTPGRALSGLALMAIGLPFYWYWSRTSVQSDKIG
jgi:basic amino acid/polyamine antiporter, APA family